MGPKRLLWQIFTPYLLITLTALLMLTWYASRVTRQYYIRQKKVALQAEAGLIEGQVFQNFTPLNYGKINSLCRGLGEKSKIRITVVLPRGEVIADSEKDPAGMDNQMGRPEIMEASQGRLGFSIRHSQVANKEAVYVALAEYREGKLIGFLRMSVPLTFIENALNSINKRIGLAGVIIVFLSVLPTLFISLRVSRPLEDMKRGVEKFSTGDLSHRLPLQATEEMGGLAEALNLMAAQLTEKINTIIHQRNELQAVFQSMIEGVVAVDREERLISINQAAIRLFDVKGAEVQGRGIREIIRNVELQKFIIRQLESDANLEGEIRLWDEKIRFLEIQGAGLKGANGEIIGAVIVMNDITRLRRLENIRRDFSANVSHEIRTPLTAIKGSVETLREGAIEDSRATKRFLEIISRQSDRLSSIVEDLLDLARLEQEEGGPKIKLKELPLREILESAIQTCRPRASEKGIKINLLCGDNVIAMINPLLLEQAVANLINNAIMYSDQGKAVYVRTEKTDDEIIIGVEDNGCGIEKEHSTRIFERFYRVDKARSRKLGGTGLGLAIVKHIALAHGGRVMFESVPGDGSSFYIHLPSLRRV